ncbi:hypothetical protein TIFTF001_020707 [Ficus carica]|uniref:F-box domain-containing protein n=1 Tax=Ficus carica TaxID=3494 RepID=A0AA88AYA3_FICCA|nr:hypothetical protein TIFTF001_020707 [Ficus carica]
MKEQNGMEQDQEPETEHEDRISALPDAIILHILSFLPTLHTVRTSLLSKRWRHMWTLASVLDFCDTRDIHYFRRLGENNHERKRFYKFVDECLRQPYADTTIYKVKLCMKYYGDRMDGWLRFLINKNVEELDLCILPKPGRVLYCLPHFVLHLRALNVLKLSCLALETLVPTSLPSLKELYLRSIQMDDQVLNNLLLSCPSLKKLHIDYCHGLLNPKVSSLSLEYMEFRTSGNGVYSDCQTIEVEAINLHSFICKGKFCSSKNCGMNLVHCRTIRNLSLSEAFLTDRWLEDLIPELPFLESLKLTDCYGFQHLKIRNEHLKHFVFTLSGYEVRLCPSPRIHSGSEEQPGSGQLEATIDAPNLVSFGYNGYLMFKISVNAPNLLDADIAVCDYPRKTYDVEWKVMLRKSLLWIAPTLETLPIG